MARRKKQPDRFETGIRKTGFPLEFKTARTLQRKGWSVISNRYYLDDTEETVREVDLVAYRVRKVQHFKVFTSLIINCKKSEAKAWGLLAREISPADPNADWTPTHVWSNDKALRHEISLPGFSKAFYEHAQATGVTEALRTPSADVFAFQELDIEKGTPQNDKPIFNAVTSLMKAQAYELQALPQRKKEPCIYQFNLLVVLDGDLLRLDFDDTGIRSVAVDTEHYVARYIVNKKETFARVHFLRIEQLDAVLDDYERLHGSNCTFFDSQLDNFYRHVLTDYKRRQIPLDDFVSDVSWRLEYTVRQHQSEDPKAKDLWLTRDTTDKVLCLMWNVSEEAIDALNADESTTTAVTGALKKWYRYGGPFRFEQIDDDIPF